MEGRTKQATFWHPHHYTFFGQFVTLVFCHIFYRLPKSKNLSIIRTCCEIAVNRFRWREIRLMVLSPKSGILTSSPLFRIRDLNDKGFTFAHFFAFSTLDCRFCKRLTFFPDFWRARKSKGFFPMWFCFGSCFLFEQMVDSYWIYAESQSLLWIKI